MSKSVFEGAINDSSFKNGGTAPTGKTVKDGETGYQKRTGGRFPEVIRDLNAKLEKPTKG